ncbi:hypothetical protein PVAG01_07015 [Phlyctema vagabunda]|uniref:Uncharacterized protein n=1 Tax=Phlyctema vagabunda TaxID=108571 RepID=A0ABR4PB89_9HELO
MFSHLLLLLLPLLHRVQAIDFTSYDPQPGIQPAFRPFLDALVTAAEDPLATTAYTDFFAPDGMQTTLSIHCVGAAAITACKQRFLPTDGRMSLVHFPNMTSIFSDNATATVYDSQGRIENDFTSSGGNCSQI